MEQIIKKMVWILSKPLALRRKCQYSLASTLVLPRKYSSTLGGVLEYFPIKDLLAILLNQLVDHRIAQFLGFGKVCACLLVLLFHGLAVA